MKKYALKDAKKDLPKRSLNSHKATYGKVLILAGRDGYWGAGILACKAALKVGCGYVYWGSFKNPQNVVGKIPEVLTLHIGNIKDFKMFDAVLIGPGLGVTSKTLKVLKKLKNHPCVVVDADALTVFSQSPFEIPKSWILTPHPGEMARLLKTSTKSINSNRQKAVERFRNLYASHLVLKGYKTLVSCGSHIVEIQSGNESLAKAGSGDVLSGMITSLLAQGLAPLKASCLAAFIHGYVATLWKKNFTSHSLNPSDVIEILPQVLRGLQS